MKTAIIASLIAGAAAFAPAQQKAGSTALKAFENEVGAQVPLGFFDPLGLVADGDQEKFDRLRYVELKHGRISMLAVVGYLTTYAGVRLGGDIDLSGTSFTDIPYGFDALSAMPKAGFLQLLFFIGVLEANVMKDITGGGMYPFFVYLLDCALCSSLTLWMHLYLLTEFPGDFRNGYIDFGWDNFDEETKLRKRGIELNNGRAAMMGILALMVHEQLGVSLLLEPNLLA